MRRLPFGILSSCVLIASSALAQTPPPAAGYPPPAGSYPPPAPPGPAYPLPSQAAPPPVAPPPVAPPPAPYGVPAQSSPAVPYGTPPASAVQESASQDRDAPAAGPTQDFRFYHPTLDERQLAPPPPALPVMLGILEDTHGFVSGSIRGFGDETRLRIGANQGVTIGTYNFNTFEFGYDGFRYSGVKIYEPPSGGSGLNVFLLVPNLDIRGFISASRAGLAIGTSVSGIRVAKCIQTRCLEASLRLLTLDSWFAGDFHKASPAFSVGGGLSLGVRL
jgi:hypothetical protein